jgi:hypothetical protein
VRGAFAVSRLRDFCCPFAARHVPAAHRRHLTIKGSFSRPSPHFMRFMLDQRIRVMLWWTSLCKHHTCAPSVPTTPDKFAASRGLTAISSVYNLFTRDPRNRRNSCPRPRMTCLRFCKHEIARIPASLADNMIATARQSSLRVVARHGGGGVASKATGTNGMSH